MNSVRKSTILLQSLDRTLLAQVLALLPVNQVEFATRLSTNTEGATSAELHTVFVEFNSKFRAPSLELEPIQAIPASAAQSSLAPVQLDIVKPSVPVPEAPRVTEPGPFDFLNRQHADDILQLLNDEQPQTIAVITAQLSPTVSASVLAGLSPDRQAEVLQRLARLGPTDPEILADIAAALQSRLGRPKVRSGGVPHAAAVLRQSSRAATRSMLASLDEQDSDLADELRQTLFSFDDLLKLDDDTLRLILQETDDGQWALALKASPEAVRQKVLGCLSSHVAQALRNEMDSLGPVRLSEMTSVRQQIADSIHRLETSGLISLPMH